MNAPSTTVGKGAGVMLALALAALIWLAVVCWRASEPDTRRNERASARRGW